MATSTPATVEKFGPADFLDQPWKNGGGTTQELLRAPHPHDPDRFGWRLSCARVSASGPFSVFPGIDRTLLLLEGEGFALRCGDHLEVLLTEPGQRIDFSGDVATDCRLLGGPCRDFNVMVDRALFRHELTVFKHQSAPPPISCAPLCLFYAAEGSVALAESGSHPSTLLIGGELARIIGATRFQFQPVSPESLAIKVDLYPVRPPGRI